MIDLHTHTTFSFDGVSPAEETLREAARLGMSRYGLSEHFNYDCIVLNYPVEQIDAERYFGRARELAETYAGRMRVLVGAEFGFDGSGMAQEAADRLVQMDVHTSKSYGVANVHKRLDIFGRGRCKFYISAREGLGTCVMIELPVQTGGV